MAIQIEEAGPKPIIGRLTSQAYRAGGGSYRMLDYPSMLEVDSSFRSVHFYVVFNKGIDFVKSNRESLVEAYRVYERYSEVKFKNPPEEFNRAMKWVLHPGDFVKQYQSFETVLVRQWLDLGCFS